MDVIRLVDMVERKSSGENGPLKPPKITRYAHTVRSWFSSPYIVIVVYVGVLKWLDGVLGLRFSLHLTKGSKQS